MRANDFAVGDRVRIDHHWEWPDGTIGTVSEPEPMLIALSGPGEWQGHRRIHPGRTGQIVSYFIQFDRPTDDGSGDGPYRGGEVEAECLELLFE